MCFGSVSYTHLDVYKRQPFDFVLEITHRLENNRLSVEWNVKNVDDKEMYFTIGGHPAFNVNILPDTDFEDYSLVFKEGIETLSYILIDAENGTALIDKTYKLELTNSKYALKKDMFDKDALISVSYTHLDVYKRQLR